MPKTTSQIATVKHVATETEKEFKESFSGLVEGALYKVMDQWIFDHVIRNFKIIAGDKLIVITEDVEQDNEDFKYSIFRFFPGGKEGWHVSVDLDNRSMNQVTEHLLKSYK